MKKIVLSKPVAVARLKLIISNNKGTAMDKSRLCETLKMIKSGEIVCFENFSNPLYFSMCLSNNCTLNLERQNDE